MSPAPTELARSIAAGLARLPGIGQRSLGAAVTQALSDLNATTMPERRS